MNRLLLLILLLTLHACTSHQSDQQKIENTNDADEEVGFFDFDANGESDMIRFIGEYDIDTLHITLNGKDYYFQSVSTVFDTIREEDFNIDYVRYNERAIFLKNIKGQLILLTKERPDFAGPTFNLYGLKNGKPARTFSIQRELIDAITVDSLQKSYIVLQTIPGEPGFHKGYTYVEIPLFELYEIEVDKVVLDSNATLYYNMKNTKDFLQFNQMVKPVKGFKGEDNYGDLKLMDLDTVSYFSNSEE